MKNILAFFYISFLFFEWAFAFMLFSYLGFVIASASYIHDVPKDLPNNIVVLILGTSKKTKGGNFNNQFFENRIQAAYELYEGGNTDCFLVSGDNSEKYYNEPYDMKVELKKLGIQPNIINLDYAGFSTYESVVRAKEIFGVEKCIIVSQRFHLERAIWLARSVGIEAYGYPAKDVSANYSFKTIMREFPARILALWDWVFRPRPKFLGKKEHLRCQYSFE